jgi:hypothetical protein
MLTKLPGYAFVVFAVLSAVGSQQSIAREAVAPTTPVTNSIAQDLRPLELAFAGFAVLVFLARRRAN